MNLGGLRKTAFVSVLRCKPCQLTHDKRGMPKYSPGGVSQKALSRHAIKTPPDHVTRDDVETFIERGAVDMITGHQPVRALRGKIAVMFGTHWQGLVHVTWERELDLAPFLRNVFLYWIGIPSARSADEQEIPCNAKGSCGS